MKASAVGIPWYRPEHYDELRRLCNDAHKLAPTYGEWLAAAERAERRVKAGGQLAVRAELTPEGFRDWCRRERLQPDSHARGKYASEFAYRAVMGQRVRVLCQNAGARGDGNHAKRGERGR